MYTISGYFFAGSKLSGLVRIACSFLPSPLMYSTSSDLPQTNCDCCGLAFDTFFMSLKVESLDDPEVREFVEARQREDERLALGRLGDGAPSGTLSMHHQLLGRAAPVAGMR